MAKKKVVKKKKQKKSTAKPVRHEIVVRVDSSPLPTVSDLVEPERDGKKLTIPKTWLSEAQIMRVVQRTPAEYVYKRKGKGGKDFDYVTGSYVEKVLNFVFGWNWDFEVVEHGVRGPHLWVMGRLTVRSSNGEKSIVKTQFGRKEIAYLKDKAKTDENMLDFGNDLKAAATDAMKKCASLLGIASDIYGKADYKDETGKDPRDDAPQGQNYGPSHEEPVVQIGAPVKLKPGQAMGPDNKPTYVCSIDGDPISEQVANYSLNAFGKRLCREHQVDAKKK